MEENKSSEIVSDEIEETVTEEATEPEEEIAEKLDAEDSEVTVVTDEETAAEPEATDEEAAAESEATEEETEEEPAAQKKPKKKRLLQTPVIISACLVLAVLIAYFVYTSFFLREPEGVVWTTDIPMYDSTGNPVIDSDGNTVMSTYYFEFDKDNIFRSYMGSAEIEGKYNKEKGTESGDTLSVSVSAGVFYAGLPAEYTITGSRILNNQELHLTQYDGTEYTLSQSKCELPEVELPNDFKADEKLLGEWVAMDMGQEVCRVNFFDNGYMTLKFLDYSSSYSLTYKGSYTLEGNTLNFTYYTTSSSVAAPLPYEIIDDNTLNFINAYFVRAESLATADEAA